MRREAHSMQDVSAMYNVSLALLWSRNNERTSARAFLYL